MPKGLNRNNRHSPTARISSPGKSLSCGQLEQADRLVKISCGPFRASVRYPRGNEFLETHSSDCHRRRRSLGHHAVERCNAAGGQGSRGLWPCWGRIEPSRDSGGPCAGMVQVLEEATLLQLLGSAWPVARDKQLLVVGSRPAQRRSHSRQRPGDIVRRATRHGRSVMPYPKGANQKRRNVLRS